MLADGNTLVTERNIFSYDELDSTSEEAKRMVRSALAHQTLALTGLYGSVVTARRQTAGRGRRGRSFSSPGSGSLYASFILEPPVNPAEQRITALAAVAVCKAIENTTIYKPAIKWINDILVDGKKVCGILAEAIPGAVILGIGVNINLCDADFPEELAGIAGSLQMDDLTREHFFEELTAEVFLCTAGAADETACKNGDDSAADQYQGIAQGLRSSNCEPGYEAATLMDAYRERSILLGKRVVVMKENEERPATAIAVKDDGALVVEYEYGDVDTLRSSRFSIRLVD